MTRDTLDRAAVTAFLVARHGDAVCDSAIEIRPLPGGLCSEVALVTARLRGDGSSGARRIALVAKLVHGRAAREAAVYRRLSRSVGRRFSPELLGAERLGRGRWLLYLERIEPAHAWPWADSGHTARVIERLARLHEEAATGASLPAWDYEAENLAVARDTLSLAERLPRGEVPELARALPALRRVVAALPAMRRQLLAFQPLGRAVIHGDVHPGNVIVRQRDGVVEPVLLDWARARIGSPLEDLSSWLQALGTWEPEARRRHDTLLAGYLSARGFARELSRPLRDAYWFAAASNALAGALGYHLAVVSRASEPGATQSARAAAARNAADWLRVIRRADACWR
ncbi:aminoglycoside phosphotransferase family protein [Sorangium sp. So ce375]|uniref:phosphotransferase family protein n=1 Tax=Sorangium sp. So ce375 TaxID=3133306 RepID=UPI003F5B4CEF